jgi:excisionase family DNA binding protein
MEQEKTLFTIPEASKLTRMSIPWWRAAVSQRRVRVVRFGRKTLISKDTLDEMIKNGTTEPVKPRG